MATSRVPNEVVADNVRTLRRVYEQQMTGVATGTVSPLCIRLQYGNREENRMSLKDRSRLERGTVQSVKHLLTYRKIALPVSSWNK
jgi:hypothetical protein